MNIFDIHSHILPAVDDGPIDIETSLKLLSLMRDDGITDVIATPHFIATRENLEEYMHRVNNAYLSLKEACKDKDYPNIFLGSEIFYFSGIGRSKNIAHLALCGSDYLLLELPMCTINQNILNDITDLSENFGITPIIAHIERYTKQKGFKDLLSLIEQGVALAQINCTAVLDARLKKAVFKLISKGYISFIATDTHSVSGRPPLMQRALTEIGEKLGEDIKEKFISNGQNFHNEIAQEKCFAV